MIPNLFIPGARDSATKHLTEALAGHRDIYMGREREPELFARNDVDEGSLYPDYAGERWVMDGSEAYLPIADVLPRIDEACADPRFIIVLRDPVQRAESAYRHLSADDASDRRPLEDIVPPNLAEMDLDELVSWEASAVGKGVSAGSVVPKDETLGALGFPHRYFWVGRYGEQIARYRALFPRDSFLFLTHEQVKNDFDATLAEVGRFLGVDPAGFPTTQRPTPEAGAPRPERRREHEPPNAPEHRPTGKRGLALGLARGVTKRLSGVLPEGVAMPARKAIKELLGVPAPTPTTPTTPRSAPTATATARTTNARHPAFRADDERALRRIFVPEIEKAEALTGLDLSEWK